jgi:hypothetical protein
MATPTTFFGLQKPADGENYDLDLINANSDAIDLGLVKVAIANSTYNLNGISGVTSKFTRLSIGNQGIIIAEFGLDLDTNTIVIAASTAAPTALPALIPVGFRPFSAPHSIPLYGTAPVTNAGSGASLQWGFNTSGDVLLRSTGAAYTTVTGTDMNFACTYRWDGNT